MPIKRYVATKDNTITNAYKEDLTTRATGSNMGASDVLEVFSIYGQASATSVEKARILVYFPITDIVASRTAGLIPASGSVKFYLRLFNAEHAETTPSNFTVKVNTISQSWTEGAGLDMETYKDLGASNWISRSVGRTWTTAGGQYYGLGTTAQHEETFTFTEGTEDLLVDVSSIIEPSIASTLPNFGFLVRLDTSFEDGSQKRSYYTKRFFGRGSQHFYKRPILEARWDKSILDDRSQIFKSSSLAPSEDNLNSIYLYNKVRGNLKDIPITADAVVTQLYSSSVGGVPQGQPVSLVTKSGTQIGGVTHGNATFITASGGSSALSKGVYRAQFCYNGSKTKLYDVWGTSKDGVFTTLLTGSGFTVKTDQNDPTYEAGDVVVNITNLKSSYSKDENVTFKVHTRDKSWSPNLYTKATNTAPVSLIREAYYKIVRVADNLTVVPYSTGSGPSFSRLSYGVSGSYFDFDMSNLESNYLYEISILRKQDDRYIEQKEKFRFRVDT